MQTVSRPIEKQCDCNLQHSRTSIDPQKFAFVQLVGFDAGQTKIVYLVDLDKGPALLVDSPNNKSDKEDLNSVCKCGQPEVQRDRPKEFQIQTVNHVPTGVRPAR